jgi:Transcriptional regulator containing an amidase domain and an AraC-type DNA-binding HTH domain
MIRRHTARAGDGTQKFVFLLVPGLSMMSLASALEPLRACNRLTRRNAYAWQLTSVDGSAIQASNGIPLPTISCQGALSNADYLFVCGGLRIQKSDENRYLAVLREAAASGIALGALSTGTYLLARAGLLSGYRCTIHWENHVAFQEEFPNLNCTNSIYEIDRDRLTCSGGTAALDMMLHLIAEKHGGDRAREVANQFHHHHIRDASEDQRGGRQEVLAHLPERLQTAIRLMQSHIEDPISLPDIAKQVGVGARQLERLFMRHTGMAPLHYYMRLRIERARELLIYSDLPLIDVAVSCGFTSPSHFSTWYKRIYDTKPSEVRDQDRLPAAHATVPARERA